MKNFVKYWAMNPQLGVVSQIPPRSKKETIDQTLDFLVVVVCITNTQAITSERKSKVCVRLYLVE